MCHLYWACYYKQYGADAMQERVREPDDLNAVPSYRHLQVLLWEEAWNPCGRDFLSNKGS